MASHRPLPPLALDACLAETTTSADTVFHCPGGEAAYVERVCRNAPNLADDPTVDGALTVVCSGDSVTQLQPGAEAAPAVETAIDSGITGCGCQNSLEAVGLSTAALLDDIDVVPTAMGELTRQQAAAMPAAVPTTAPGNQCRRLFPSPTVGTLAAAPTVSARW